jgi:two-component system, cell cycle sensor histidine kinase and response regulator CckA
VVQFKVTDSIEAFRRSFEELEFDVILADFNLRRWTALDALDILHDSGKDIPLIVTTGCLGYEPTVECIKSGAADSVLKDRPARLPSAVQRALNEKRLRDERKSVEAALRRSEERFKLIEENIDEVFWIGSPDASEIMYLSPAYERVWGQPRERLMENPMSYIEAVHPEDRERVLSDLKLQKEGKSYDHVFRMIHPDGSTRWISNRGFPIRDQVEDLT